GKGPPPSDADAAAMVTSAVSRKNRWHWWGIEEKHRPHYDTHVSLLTSRPVPAALAPVRVAFLPGGRYPSDMEYQVELEAFRGPLDLLLFLVKRNEVDICDIPIAKIAAQFQEYLNVLQEIDV